MRANLRAALTRLLTGALVVACYAICALVAYELYVEASNRALRAGVGP